MGHRLSRIYTRTGDDGSTALADGTRLPKDAARLEAMGAVDELNSQIGLLLAYPVPETLRESLQRVQHRLFDLGGELAVPGRRVLQPGHAAQLEAELDELNAPLPALKEFILPGGGGPAATCHIVRTVCRRAERRLVSLAREDGDVNPAGLQYLNRLSDLAFVMARVLSMEPEVSWHPTRSQD